MQILQKKVQVFYKRVNCTEEKVKCLCSPNMLPHMHHGLLQNIHVNIAKQTSYEFINSSQTSVYIV